MRLTVVGCSGSFPGPRSAASCYLLEAEAQGRTWRLVVDLGSGALGALQNHIDLDDVDALALSHLHADHCFDVCSYYVVRKYHPAGQMRRIPVYGPSPTAEFLARAYDIPVDPGMTEQFDFVTWRPGDPVAIGPFTLDAMAVDHPVEAYGLTITAQGRTLAYTGDTGPFDGLAELARGADALLAEASFLEGVDNPPHLHLTGADAGRVAKSAGVDRLLLTHIPPWHDRSRVEADARSVYDGRIHLVEAGETHQV